MIYKEFKNKIAELTDEFYYGYDVMGVRFEDKERGVGEIIMDRSRSNPDRCDEREFPEYGTEEYDDMEELDGVSAWGIHVESGWGDIYGEDDSEAEELFIREHCYFIGGQKADNGEDPNEIVIEDAKVLWILF